MSQDPRLLAEPSDVAKLFANDMEKNYFDIWYSLTGVLGGGFFKDDFWRRTIPQLSRDHPSIRYAAMAIGAVGIAVRPRLQKLSHAELRAKGPHYDKALMYYNQAIREVRSAAVSESSLRAAVICCILFVCFEALHGDGGAALQHIGYGQKMMDELMDKSNKDVATGLGDETLEDDTLHVFQRLILQSWTCGIVRPRKLLTADGKPKTTWCCQGGSKGTGTLDKMPDRFDDLDEARRWWDVTQHFIIHRSNSAYTRFETDLPGMSVHCRMREALNGEPSHIDPMDDGEPRDLRIPEHQEYFARYLQQWADRFRPLYDRARQYKNEDIKTYLQGISLQVQYIALYICVRAPLACELEVMQGMTPQFREMVRLSRTILESQPRVGGFESREVFTMDTGPTWPLFITAVRCRDADVRSEAVELLQSHPRRDGLWDSRLFAAMGLRGLESEFENAIEGTESEQWKRLQQRVLVSDSKGCCTLRYLTRDTQTGTWIPTTESIWPYLAKVEARALQIHQELDQKESIAGKTHMTVGVDSWEKMGRANFLGVTDVEGFHSY